MVECVSGTKLLHSSVLVFTHPFCVLRYDNLCAMATLLFRWFPIERVKFPLLSVISCNVVSLSAVVLQQTYFTTKMLHTCHFPNFMMWIVFSSRQSILQKHYDTCQERKKAADERKTNS